MNREISADWGQHSQHEFDWFVYFTNMEELPMKHLKPKSKPRPIRAQIDPKGAPIRNPCEGLEGKELCKCQKTAYKGGVVY